VSQRGEQSGQLVAIFEEATSFRRNICEALVDMGHEVATIESWEEAERFVAERDHEIDVGILGSRIPGSPTGELLEVVQDELGALFPSFRSMSVRRPTTIEALALRRRGGCGFLERTSSIKEIVFRVDAQLRGLTPSTYVAAPRVQLDMPMTFSHCSDDQGIGEEKSADTPQWDHGLLRNISRTGLLVTTSSTPQPGDELQIRLSLSEEIAQVNCRGRVVRVEQPLADRGREVGVVFEQLSLQQERSFSEFVMGRLRVHL